MLSDKRSAEFARKIKGHSRGFSRAGWKMTAAAIEIAEKKVRTHRPYQFNSSPSSLSDPHAQPTGKIPAQTQQDY